MPAPSARSSNIAWLDAQTLSPSLANGANVTSIAGFTASTTPPTFALNALRPGESVINFNGNSSLLLALSSHPAVAALFGSGVDHDFTVTVMFTPPTITTGNQGIVSTGSGYQRLQILGDFEPPSSYTQIENYDGVTNGSPLTVRNWLGCVYPFTIAYTASTHSVLIGNTDGSFQTFAATLPANGGGDLLLGMWPGGFAFDGGIWQFLLDNAALTQAQIQADQTYFATRLDTVLVLPVGDSRTKGNSTEADAVGGFTPFPWPLQAQAILNAGNTGTGTYYVVLNLGDPGQGAETVATTSATVYAQAAQSDNPLYIRRVMPSLFGTNNYGYPSLGLNAVQTGDALVACNNNWLARQGANGIPGIYQTIYTSEIDRSNGDSVWDTFRAAMLAEIQAHLSVVPGITRFCNLEADPLLGPDGASSNLTDWSTDQLHLIGVSGGASGTTPGGGYGLIAGHFATQIAALTADLSAPVNATSFTLAASPGSVVTGVPATITAMLAGGTALASTLVITLIDSLASTVLGTISIANGALTGTTTVNPTVVGTHAITSTHTGGGFTAGNGSTSFVATAPVGALVWPVPTDVRSPVVYGPTSNLVGSAHIPTASQVVIGVLVDATTGNVTIPTVGQVELGQTFGPSLSETGTFVGSGGGGGSSGPSLEEITAAIATALGSGITVLSPAGLDQVEVESGVNARQALSPTAALAGGIIQGASIGASTITVKAIGAASNGPTRVTAVVDQFGNRPVVTLNLPT